jgi:hypothetical protein
MNVASLVSKRLLASSRVSCIVLECGHFGSVYCMYSGDDGNVTFSR